MTFSVKHCRKLHSCSKNQQKNNMQGMEAVPYSNHCLVWLHSIFHVPVKLLSARGLSHFENQVTKGMSQKASKESLKSTGNVYISPRYWLPHTDFPPFFFFFSFIWNSVLVTALTRVHAIEIFSTGKAQYAHAGLYLHSIRDFWLVAQK